MGLEVSAFARTLQRDSQQEFKGDGQCWLTI